MKKRLKLFMGLTFASVQCVLAQQIPGLQYSNYGGLYRATYNPATLGASRYKFQINIGSLGGSINHRYLTFLGKNSLLYPLLTPHSTQELYGRSRTMGSIVQKDPLYLVSEIRWPSAMISIGDNQGIAFQFRSRGYVQGKNIPDAVRNLYFKRLDTGSNPVLSNQAWGDFSLVQQSFSEASVSYGIALLNTEVHKLKVGATLKKIFGARVGYLKGSVDNYGIRALNSETSELLINNFTYESGYTQVTQPVKVGNLFDSKQYGSGWGYDLGASYEFGSVWKNDKEEFDQSPQYLIRLGVSATDIGSIRYKTANSRVVTGSQATAVVNQTTLEKIADNGPEGFMDVFAAKTDASFDKKVRLPQALHFDADVQLIKGFFLNLSQTKRAKSNSSESLDIFLPNTFTITPRFEDEDSDFAFPVSFIDGNKKPSFGFLSHFGPIFLGFSDVNVLFKKSGVGMVYVGVSAWKLKGGKKLGSTGSGKN